mgnify:CR=1 FL=1
MKDSSRLFKTANFGYHIPLVNQAISRYNKIIKDLQDNIAVLQDKLREKDVEIDKCYKEIKSLNLEMSLMQVPELGESREYMILNQFKNRKVEDSEEPTSPPTSKKSSLDSIETSFVDEEGLDLEEKDDDIFEIIE